MSAKELDSRYQASNNRDLHVWKPMEDFDKFEEGEEVDYDFNLDDDLLDEGATQQAFQ